MSLKLDKHLLLVLAVLMMLVLIPTAFANDVDDAGAVGVNNQSAVDVVAQPAADDVAVESVDDSAVDDKVSASDESDVVGSGEDYITVPSPKTVTDYKIGDSVNVVVTPTIDDWCKGEIEQYLNDVYVYIDNDFDGKIVIPGVSTTSAFNFNLNTLTADQLSVGTHTLKFGVNYESLENWRYSTDLQTMSVTVVGSGSGSGGSGGTDPEPEVGKYYVGPDGVGTDADGYGTKNNPYATISYALSKASAGEEIILQEGTHTVSSQISINKNINIVGLGEVNLTNGNGNTIFTDTDAFTITFENITFRNIGASLYYYRSSGHKGTLTFNDCNFIDNKAAVLICCNNNVNIVRCNFINNEITGSSGTHGFIYNYYGATMDISYSNFINNIMSGYYFVDDNNNAAKCIANNNYWGPAGVPTSLYSSGSSSASRLTRTNYVTIVGDAEDTIYAGSAGNINVKFVDDSGNDISGMAKLPIELSSANSAQFTPSSTVIDDEVTVSYSNANSGEDTVYVNYGTFNLASFTVTVDESPVGTLFVDASTGSDDTGDGTPGNKFASIGKALEELGTNYKISVSAGEYTLNNGQITQDVEIIGKGNVVITTTSNHLTISGNKNVNLTNLKFKGATSTSIVSDGDLKITNCVFEDNAGDNVIQTTGKADIAYSAFVGNTVTGAIVSAVSGDVSNNFWGNNADPGLTGVTYTNWAILSLVMDDEIYTGGDYTANAKLTDNSGADLADSIASFDVAFSKTNGDATLTPASATVSDNVATATYTPTAVGNDRIAVSIGSDEIDYKEIEILEDDTSKIYVDATRGVDASGRGSKAKPYATIQYAYNQASSGDEIAVSDGTYDFASSLSISRNTKLTAIGDNVILKGAGSSSILSPSYYYDVEIVGFTFINGGGSTSAISQGSSGSGSLKIINCTFANSTAQYNVVKMYTSGEITGCTFVNNTITSYNSYTAYKGFIYAGSTVNINYNIFVDNTLTNANSLMVEAGSSATVNINNNYWGTNDGLDSSKYSASGVTCDNFLILETTAITGDVYVGIPTELTAEFKTNDGSALSGKLLNKHITFGADNGDASPATTAITNNKITTTYTPTSAGSENVVANIEGVELTKWAFNTVELPAGTLLVDAAKGSDTTGDGSATNPYATIKTALDNLGTNTAIMVQAGEYELTDYSLNKEVTITGVGNVVITSTNDYHLDIGSVDVTLNNLVFKGAQDTSIKSGGDVTVTKCVFTDNDVSYLIDTNKNVYISYTIFANNNVNIDILSAIGGTVSNNFWGTNDAPSTGGLTCDNWVVIDMTIPDMTAANTLPAETNHAVKVSFNSTTDGTTLSALAESMHDFDVTLNAGGAQTVTISDNIGVGNYISNVEGPDQVTLPIVSKTISFTVTEREAGRIYVDQATGDDASAAIEDKSKPYKTITAAMAANEANGGGFEIIVNEGTYTENQFLKTKDVNITGRGNVVLDLSPNDYGMFKYGSSNTKVVLNNLTVINNAKSIDYVSDITIINCTFANSTASNFIATGYGKTVSATITNSSFINLKFTSGSYNTPFGTSSYQMSSLDISNSVFIDVTYSSYYFAYATSVVANGNFWGSNDDPSSKFSGVTVANWVVANVTIDSNDVHVGDEPAVTVKFTLNDGSELTKSMPITTLELTSDLGNSFESSKVTLKANEGTTKFTPTKRGNEVINLTAGGNVVDSLAFAISDGDGPDYIFVNASVETSGDGKLATPYKTLKEALDVATDGKSVIILEGPVSIDNYVIDKDITVRYSVEPVEVTATGLTIGADVVFDNLIFKDGSAITVTENNKLDVIESTFIGNAGAITSSGTLTISKSKFINNSAVSGQGIISALAGSVNIALSEFIANNNGQDLIVYAASGVTADIENNYWGSNDAPAVSDSIKPTNWVALVIGLSEESINASEVQTLSLDFKNTTDGTTFADLTDNMPDLAVAVEPAIGSVAHDSLTITANSASTEYTATTEGAETINFNTEGVTFETLTFDVGASVEGMIFVNGSVATNGDGSRLRPFKDLDSAFSAVNDAKNKIIVYEGTYNPTNYYNVYTLDSTKSFTMTGVGEVILTRPTGSSYGNLFKISNNVYTYTFNNIIFSNIDATQSNYKDHGSVFYVQSWDSNCPTLNIVNCTFENNKAQNGVIYTGYYYYANVNIEGTKFINNIATQDSLIKLDGGNLEISYSAFVDNTYTGNIVSAQTADVDYNFWGTNDKPALTGITVNNWIVVEASIDADTIVAGQDYNLVLTFKSTADGVTNASLGDKVIPDVTVSLASVLNGIDSTATLSNNVANVAYSPTADGDEEITVSLGANTLTTLKFLVEEADDGTKIFVDAVNGNNANTGSKDSPVKDLATALTLVTDTKNKISLQEGTYEITGTIDKDVTIYGKGAVTIKPTGLTIDSDVNISDVTIDGVIESTGNLTIDHVKFLSVASTDGVIRALSGTLNIAYSEFVNCSSGDVLVYADAGVTGDVNNNYWGTNDGPSASNALTQTSWIKLDKEIGYVTQGHVYDLTIKFVDNNGNGLTEVMPELDISLTPAIGEVDPQSATIADNKVVVTYDATTMGSEQIAVSSEGATIYTAEFEVEEDETGKVFVGENGVDASGRGSKGSPYKTISYALNNLGLNTEIVVLEGTYSTDSTYTINKNVVITGRGAKLTRTGTGPLFSIPGTSSGYTLTLNNLIIENVTASSSSSGVIYFRGYSSGYGAYATKYYTNLNIVNCTFNNNGGYSIIYGNNYQNLNITESKFINNHPSNNVIYLSYYNHGDITKSIFYNNTMTSYPAVISTASSQDSNTYFNANYNIFIANSGSTSSVLSGSNFDNNYYGTNNESDIKTTTGTRSNYVILVATISDDDLYVGKDATLTLAFKDNEGNDLTDSMPAITLSLYKVLGNIESTVLMENNGATATYTTVAQGDETITVKYGETTLETLEFYVDESPLGKIFVDENAADGGDGSRDAPFKTIADAIAENIALGGNQIIVIKKGTYELSNAEISENVTIRAEDDVVINGANGNVLTIKENANVTLINVNIAGAANAITTEQNTKLEIINSTFENNDGVIVSNGETIVYRTVFTNNAGTVIKAEAGSLDVSYSAFTKNAGTLIESSIAATANNNFWGTNAVPNIAGVTIDKFVIVNATLAGAPDIFAETEYDIELKFVSDDGSDLADTIPDVEVELNADLGTVDSTAVISENAGVVKYITNDVGTGEINVELDNVNLATIAIDAAENQAHRIYVSQLTGDDTTGNGSLDNPYATITKALSYVTDVKNEIVVFDGTYSTTSYYYITKDMAITGRGDVTLTGEASYLFYLSSGGKLNLTGLTISGFKSTSTYNKYMIYAYGSSWSGRCNVNINDCTLENNEATLVYLYYSDAVVTNSNIIANNAGSSYLFSAYDTSNNQYDINYCNIVGNTFGLYAVYGKGQVNYNYWGTNDESELPSISYITTRDNWVILTPSISTRTIYQGDEYEITAVFNYTTDGTTLLALDKSMPTLTVDLSSNLDENNPNAITISDNIGTTIYKAYASGDEQINFTVSGVKVGELTFTVANHITIEIVKENEGENVTVIVKLTDSNATDAIVTIDGQDYPVPLTNGEGNTTLHNLKPGDYDAVAYVGDYVNFESFTINLRELNLTFEIADDIKYGDDVVIKVIPSLNTLESDITVYVDTTSYTATKADDYTITITGGLPAGEHNVVAIFIGDEFHKNTDNSTQFTVAKKATEITQLEITATNVSAPVTIKAYIDAEGNVTFDVDGATYSRVIDQGVATLELTDVIGGEHKVTAIYAENDNYLNASANATFTVAKLGTEITQLEITATDVTAPVTIKAYIDAEGNVTFDVDGATYSRVIDQGVATLELTDVIGGEHKVTATFDETDKYMNSTKNDTFTVDKIDPEITINDIDPLKVNETVSVVINTGAATGNFTVKVNDGDEFTVLIDNGKAEFTYDKLVAGTNNITATYNGDDTYNAKALDVKQFTAEKVSVYDIAIETVGTDVVVTLPADATGVVNVTVNGKSEEVPVDNGKATVPIADLTPGDYKVNVTYDGNGIYDKNTANTTINVAKYESATTVEVQATDYKAKAIITVTVTDKATGDVTVYIDGQAQAPKALNGTTAVFEVSLTAGDHEVYAEYAGDDNFTGSTSDVKPVNVAKADAALSAEPVEITEGETATITVNVDANATGVVYLDIDGKKLYADVSAGKAVFNIADLASDNYTASILYSGDENFNNATGTVTVKVNAKPVAPEPQVNVTIPEIVPGEASAINVTLPSDAKGNVSLIVDGKKVADVPVVNGSASVPVPELSAGDHNVEVAYSGDGKYAPVSKSSTVSVPKVDVPQNSTSIDVAVGLGEKDPTITVTLPKDATGYVVVSVDGVDYFANVANGTASVDVLELDYGVYDVNVTYSGDDKYNPLFKNTTANIPKPVLTAKNVNVVYSAKGTFKVLVSVDGKAVGAGEEVTIKFNGKSKVVKTDAKGYATYKFTAKLKVKKYTITATYKGIKVSKKVTVQHVIKASNKKVKKSKKVTKVKITLKKVNKKYLKKKTVKVKFNGKTYKVKTNKKGKATWKVKKSMLKKLKVGKKYKYTVTYGKDKVTKKLTIKK